MLDVLNALFLGFHVAASPIYIRTDVEIKLPELGEVVYKEGFKPALFSTPCRYSGVVVAYDRDWVETRDKPLAMHVDQHALPLWIIDTLGNLSNLITDLKACLSRSGILA